MTDDVDNLYQPRSTGTVPRPNAYSIMTRDGGNPGYSIPALSFARFFVLFVLSLSGAAAFRVLINCFRASHSRVAHSGHKTRIDHALKHDTEARFWVEPRADSEVGNFSFSPQPREYRSTSATRCTDHVSFTMALVKSRFC